MISGGILLAVSIVGAASLLNNEGLRTGDFGRDPGPGLLPVILLVLLAAGSLVLTVMGAVRLRATAGGARRDATPWRVFVFPVAMLTALGLYVWAMAPLGFIEATLAFVVPWVILLGWQDDGMPSLGRLSIYAVQAVGIVAAVWLVFAGLIKVPLP